MFISVSLSGGDGEVVTLNSGIAGNNSSTIINASALNLVNAAGNIYTADGTLVDASTNHHVLDQGGGIVIESHNGVVHGGGAAGGGGGGGGNTNMLGLVPDENSYFTSPHPPDQPGSPNGARVSECSIFL